MDALPVAEIVAPGPQIAVVAVAPLPALGGKDRSRLAVLCRAMLAGTETYGRREMAALTDGNTVRVQALSDAVIVRFSVPQSSLSAGLDLMDALVRRASLTDAAIDAATVALVRRVPAPWDAVVGMPAFDAGAAEPSAVRALYGRVFRPATLRVLVAGPVVRGEADALWQVRTAGWLPAPLPRFPDDSPVVEAPLAHSIDGPAVRGLELRGPEVPAADAALPTRLLALVALGAGKGSGLHRIAREREAWSYRQEALLSPTPKGWVSRIVLATTQDELEVKAETLRKALLEDILAWTEADRERALGVVAACRELDLPLLPLALGDATLGDGLEDRAAFAAYWRAKTGQAWDLDRLLNSMRSVNLTDLREAAHEIVASARVVVR